MEPTVIFPLKFGLLEEESDNKGTFCTYLVIACLLAILFCLLVSKWSYVCGTSSSAIMSVFDVSHVFIGVVMSESGFGIIFGSALLKRNLRENYRLI